MNLSKINSIDSDCVLGTSGSQDIDTSSTSDPLAIPVVPSRFAFSPLLMLVILPLDES